MLWSSVHDNYTVAKLYARPVYIMEGMAVSVFCTFQPELSFGLSVTMDNTAAHGLPTYEKKSSRN